MDEQLKTTFLEYKQAGNLRDVTASHPKNKLVYVDEHVPNLIAVSFHSDLATSTAYKAGKLIFQDKASCFPAYLLDPTSEQGNLIDACAAPGNKTTHLAALLADGNRDLITSTRPIIACEKDSVRSNTLTKMVKLARADNMVEIKAKHDFLKLNPGAKEYANISSLMLDPSCSGSGIMGRDDASITIHLPSSAQVEAPRRDSKKRKRGDGHGNAKSDTIEAPVDTMAGEVPTEFESNTTKLQARLEALSAFQLRLLKHAMSFPAAKRITYSTCSIHNEENEHVVVRALNSQIAIDRGWRIMRRAEQVEGLRKWHRRGSFDAVVEASKQPSSTQVGLDAAVVSNSCIRCEKGGKDGTMGFFVAGFVRDVEDAGLETIDDTDGTAHGTLINSNEEDDEEWNGFGDDDG